MKAVERSYRSPGVRGGSLFRLPKSIPLLSSGAGRPPGERGPAFLPDTAPRPRTVPHGPHRAGPSWAGLGGHRSSYGDSIWSMLLPSRHLSKGLSLQQIEETNKPDLSQSEAWDTHSSAPSPHKVTHTEAGGKSVEPMFLSSRTMPHFLQWGYSFFTVLEGSFLRN